MRLAALSEVPKGRQGWPEKMNSGIWAEMKFARKKTMRNVGPVASQVGLLAGGPLKGE